MQNSIKIIDLTLDTMQPVTSNIGEIKIANKLVKEHIQERLAAIQGEVECVANFYISEELLDFCQNSTGNIKIINEDSKILLQIKRLSDEEFTSKTSDDKSIEVKYAHDLLFLLERIFDNITEDKIDGELKNNVNYDGVLQVGKNSVILPGVYIEGKVTIGENCKIGPNCYIRGNTSIGNNCHIGQSVEVKNSLLLDKVSVGHLSYLGDGVVCNRVNFGAGTICSNLRHDGTSHKTMVNHKLVDTKRRKFSTIIGEDVHLGINTTIYPGRKVYSNSMTRPGEVIVRDCINS